VGENLLRGWGTRGELQKMMCRSNLFHMNPLINIRTSWDHGFLHEKSRLRDYNSGGERISGAGKDSRPGRGGGGRAKRF